MDGQLHENVSSGERSKVVVVSVVRDFSMYDKCIRENPYCSGCELHPVDNRSENEGIPHGYNGFLRSRPSYEDAWYVFCHEDWQPKENLVDRITRLGRDSLWGVIGASTRVKWGFWHQWSLVGTVFQCNKDGSALREIGQRVPVGSVVDTFDCQCLIVHSSQVRAHRLSFDEHLTFDLYAEDLCMEAIRKGVPSRIVPIEACHWSGGSVQPRYFAQERYVNAKYPDLCLTGTSSWVLGGRTSWGRIFTVTVKRLFRGLFR